MKNEDQLVASVTKCLLNNVGVSLTLRFIKKMEQETDKVFEEPRGGKYIT